MQMDVTSEYRSLHEAFLLLSAGKRVMDAIDTTQTIVSDDAGTMKTVPTNVGSFFSKQTIVSELHIGVTEMNQGLGHLDSDRKNARHGIALSINGCEFVSQVHQPATLGVDRLIRLRKITDVLEQAVIAA